MEKKRIDLHTHTTCSDGTFTPKELIEHAKASNLYAVSITDHDTIAAYPEAFSIAKSCDIVLISGVELSCLFEGESVHVLGYGFDVENDCLLDNLALQRTRRLDRNRQILQKLADKGILLEESDISDSEHPHFAYGRVHIALAMHKKGYINDPVDAFKKYIGNGMSCYVEGSKWSVEEGISLIHQAGGKAVLAHPHLLRSKKFALKVLECPFDGIEAYYSRASLGQNTTWLKIAEKKGLIVTGGSDFHGAIKPKISLGIAYTPYESFEKLLLI